jgi:hypothetical protein
MSTELLVIEKLEIVPFFTKGDQLDDTLAKIRASAVDHVPDVSTLKGRNAIKANVTKVKKSRIYLENHGKDLSAEYKAIPKTIDANRKKSRDYLNVLEEEIRAPLTAWEVVDNAEKAQIADTAAYLIKFAADVEEGYRDNELIDLKAKQAEADRQAEITKAADEAKVKAEEKAADEIKQANLDRVAAENATATAKQATKDAEWLTYISEAYTHNDKLIADNNMIIAKRAADWLAYLNEAYAHNNQLIATENARQVELNRQQDNDARIKRDKEAREADTDNKRVKNVAARDAMIALGLDPKLATKLVSAISKGFIPDVTINY